MKVLSILVSYFDDEMGRCVNEHYKSLGCVHGKCRSVVFKDLQRVFWRWNSVRKFDFKSQWLSRIHEWWKEWDQEKVELF